VSARHRALRRRAVRGWTIVPALLLVVATGVAVGATLTSGPSVSSTAGSGGAAKSTGDATSTTESSLPILDLTGPQFGIAYGDVLPWMTPAHLTASLRDAVAVGVTWVRLDFSWADVQPTGPAAFRWTGLDRVVSTARALGLNILPTLAYTPKWARPTGCTSDKCEPASDSAFARFAREAAARYAPKGVRAWEIWNEENTPGFWKPEPSAADYVGLLDATAAAIRSVDPGSFIISGGLTATLTLKGAVDTRQFLAEMCALGANHVVDAIGYHPYTYPFLPTFTGTFATAWTKIADTPVSMVSILAQYGTPDLPVWLTEYGAPSTTAPTAPTSGDQVTEARQAQMATSAVSAVAASTSIGALFWYTDEDLPGTRPIDHYGLRQTDGTVKPVFAALRQAVLAVKTPSVAPARSASGRRSS
jgi:hypothetical protein